MATGCSLGRYCGAPRAARVLGIQLGGWLAARLSLPLSPACATLSSPRCVRKQHGTGIANWAVGQLLYR